MAPTRTGACRVRRAASTAISQVANSRRVEGARAQLIGAIALLAAPASEQRAHLRGIGGVSVDELGLEFDDVSGAVLGSGVLSPRQARAISSLDRQLRLMSGQKNAALWTEDALEKSAHWDTIRRLAADALAV